MSTASSSSSSAAPAQRTLAWQTTIPPTPCLADSAHHLPFALHQASLPELPSPGASPSANTPSMETLAMHDRASEQATRYLASRLKHPIHLGIILGSGLGGLVDLMQVEQTFRYDEIPGWPRATAIGHAGNLVIGSLAGVPIAALQGRLHLYEGHSRDDATRPINVLSHLGVSGWIISNAAGGLNPNFRRGDLMVIDGHLDLSFRVGRPRYDASPTDSTSVDEARPSEARPYQSLRRPVAAWHAATSCYDPLWIEHLLAVGRHQDVIIHRGCYAMVSGPNYETRAEYRAFRKLGIDAVGMSTVPEVCRARHLKAKVLGISVITNEAKPDAPIHNDADDVIAAAHDAEAGLKRLLTQWLSSMHSQLVPQTL